MPKIEQVPVVAHAHLEAPSKPSPLGDGSALLSKGLYNAGATKAPGTNVEDLKRAAGSSTLIAAPDNIYPKTPANNASPTAFAGLDLKSVEPIFQNAKSVKFTTAADNKGTEPDFFMDSSGQLRRNTNKPPSKDGKINIQLEGTNHSIKEAIKAANQNQKQALAEMIRYFQKNYPKMQVPLEWQWKMDQLDKQPPDAQPSARRSAEPTSYDDPGSSYNSSPGPGSRSGRSRSAGSNYGSDDVRPASYTPESSDRMTPLTPGSTPVSGDLSTADGRAKYAFDFFVNKGLTKEQASGIVGNLRVENPNLNTSMPGDGGASIGIGQWNGSRRRDLMAFAGQNNSSPYDFNTQLEFMWHEMTEGGPLERKALAAIRTAQTPDQAALLFSKLYERPGIPRNGRRVQEARMAMARYGNDSNTAVA